MEPWTWLVAYVVGFGLLQVLLYQRFHQRTPAMDSADGQVDQTSGGQTVTAEGTETVHCQHCGTVNEVTAMVQYCHECTESLR